MWYSAPPFPTIFSVRRSARFSLQACRLDGLGASTIVDNSPAHSSPGPCTLSFASCAIFRCAYFTNQKPIGRCSFRLRTRPHEQRGFDNLVETTPRLLAGCYTDLSCPAHSRRLLVSGRLHPSSTLGLIFAYPLSPCLSGYHSGITYSINRQTI